MTWVKEERGQAHLPNLEMNRVALPDLSSFLIGFQAKLSVSKPDTPYIPLP